MAIDLAGDRAISRTSLAETRSTQREEIKKVEIEVEIQRFPSRGDRISRRVDGPEWPLLSRRLGEARCARAKVPLSPVSQGPVRQTRRSRAQNPPDSSVISVSLWSKIRKSSPVPWLPSSPAIALRAYALSPAPARPSGPLRGSSKFEARNPKGFIDCLLRPPAPYALGPTP